MRKMRILAVVGPTASGKTALSVELARRLGGEVVSCDSMQIYRGMDIGTAKPTAEETAGIPHHMIDVSEPDVPFCAADYVSGAQAAVDGIVARGKLPIFCGGTGLYLDSLLRGGFAETQADPALRERLLAYAAEHGAHAHCNCRRKRKRSGIAFAQNPCQSLARQPQMRTQSLCGGCGFVAKRGKFVCFAVF